MSVAHAAPPTHVHHWHVNPWLAAVIALGAAVRQWGFALGETSPFDNAVTP